MNVKHDTEIYESVEAWQEKGRELFGDDQMQWRFICPSCGHVASAEDYKAAGLKSTMVAFSCVGRADPDAQDAFSGGPGPCNYAGGGLFAINPVHIKGHKSRVFRFALPNK